MRKWEAVRHGTDEDEIMALPGGVLFRTLKRGTLAVVWIPGATRENIVDSDEKPSRAQYTAQHPILPGMGLGESTQRPIPAKIIDGPAGSARADVSVEDAMRIVREAIGGDLSE